MKLAFLIVWVQHKINGTRKLTQIGRKAKNILLCESPTYHQISPKAIYFSMMNDLAIHRAKQRNFSLMKILQPYTTLAWPKLWPERNRSYMERAENVSGYQKAKDLAKVLGFNVKRYGRKFLIELFFSSFPRSRLAYLFSIRFLGYSNR